MDILYIVNNTSTCEYFDFKCSLRSLEMYGTGINRIFVAGFIPEWLNTDEVIAIPFTQSYDKKHKNILETIIYVIENSDISDEFLVSSDDYYCVDNIDFSNYPIYRRIRKTDELPGRLPRGVASTCKNPSYEYSLYSTMFFLDINRMTSYNFTLHKYKHIFKSDIKELQENGIIEKFFNESRNLEPYCLLLNYRYTEKSFNYTDIEDYKIGFPKTREEILKHDKCFSTNDFKIGSLLYDMLLGFYPNKSKYEI